MILAVSPEEIKHADWKCPGRATRIRVPVVQPPGNPPAPPPGPAADPPTPRAPLTTAVITCAVLEIEFQHFARHLKHVVHIEVLQQGLHNEPDNLRRNLQDAVDRLELIPHLQAIVLGYGLCSRGSEGVRTSRCALVIPRAHDCITLLLGSKERYAQHVARYPGTYWYSPGWNRHSTPPGKERYDKLYQEYLRKYGPDNAQFLMEEEQAWFKNYNRATYVDLGVGVTDADLQHTRQCAQFLGWSCDRQHGDPALITALLNGDWDAHRFVVLQPGQTIRMTADQRVIEPAPPQDHRT